MRLEGWVIDYLPGGGRKPRYRRVPVAYGDRIHPCLASLRRRLRGLAFQKVVPLHHDAQGSIHGLYGRAVEITPYRGIDAKDLPASVLDDLVCATPATKTKGQLFCVYSNAGPQHGIVDQAQHLPVGCPYG